MSANKHTNKLKLQNYAYEVSDNGVFIHPKETSNVWFQPFAYDNVAHAYYPIPGHGDYPFIEASDIDWRPYKIDGHDVVTSYDIIHSMEVMSSSYWVAGEGVSSIVRVIDQYMGTAAGAYAISEGVLTEASGESSHAEGDRTIAQGKNSHTEGQQSRALKVNSHAEGYGTTGDNSGAHAEGNRTTASGLQAHAEGNATEASGNNSHSEGNNTTSSGLNSHSEGASTIASGLNSHAQGNNTIASGDNSHAEGVGADGRGAIGKQSHAEGLRALASGTNSHAEGSISTASGTASHAEGNSTEASGVNSHAEGNGTKSLGSASHAEGVNTYAAGKTSHAEGKQNQAWGENSHAEGFRTYTSGMASHSEGAGTITALAFINQEANATIYETNGDVELHENDIIKYGGNFARVVSIDGNDITLSNTLGEITTDIPYAIGKIAYGDYSHAEGFDTKAIGTYSHAEGWVNKAIGESSHVEGKGVIASGVSSHAECNGTTALGNYSHAEGRGTFANGQYSHAEGFGGTELVDYKISGNGPQYVVNIQGNDIPAVNDILMCNGIISRVILFIETTNTIRVTPSFGQINESMDVYKLSGVAFDNGSHIEGSDSNAIGKNSHAEGVNTISIGSGSHSEGYNTLVKNNYGHAEGLSTEASGDASHAEGYHATASGAPSHAEGRGTIASGDASHAEGCDTTASGAPSHAEGDHTTASGVNSHAEGGHTTASNVNSHAEGDHTTASNVNSHAEGEVTIASGKSSHAEGTGTEALGAYSHSEGWSTVASGEASHAEGWLNMAIGSYSHAEGFDTKSIGSYSHAEGMSAYVSGNYAHGEGKQTFANGNCSHAEGAGEVKLTDYKLTSSSATQYTVSDIVNDVPKQNDLLMYNGIIGRVILFNSTTNILRVSPAFGTITSPTQVYKITGVAFDVASHVEGSQNIAIGGGSHAEGIITIAAGGGSHTEGFGTVVRGNYGHAEGVDTVASGASSHAEGEGSTAGQKSSHAEGNYTHAANLYEHAQGTYNLSTRTDNSLTFGSNGNTLHSIGIGTSDDDRKNAVEVMQNGDMYVIGIGDYDGTNFTTASTLQESLASSTAYAATKVNQIIATGNASYRLLFKYSPNDNPENSYTYFADSIWYNPSLDALTNKGGAYFATTSGAVGIGTATPQKKLDVQGDSMFNGIVNIDSSAMGAKTHINFNRASFNYVNVPTGGTFAVSVNGAGGAKTRLAVDNIAAFPGETNDSIDLGKPNYHWRAAYVNRIRTQSYELMETNSGTRIGFGTFNHNKAAYVNVGNLLVSNAWTDASKVPYDGIYSKGPIHVGHNTDVALGSAKTGDIVIGDFTGTNVAVDNNEIMARNNGAASTLNLNLDGGSIAVGGSITRFYKNASDEPMIALTSNDKDTWLWRINWDTTASSLATSAKYGFGLKYIGTGSGNDNSLVLYADNQAGTQVKAVEVKQNGATYTYQNIYALSYVTLGNSTTADRTTVTSVLNIDGNTTIAGYLKANAYVNLGNSTTADRTTVTSVLNVDGNTTIAGYLKANAYVTLGNSTTADRTTVTSVLNVDGNTTIKDGSYLKALGYVNLGNSTTADRTTVTSVLNIDGNTTIKDGSYLKALGNVTLGNSTTADTTTVASILNIEGNTTIKDNAYFKAFGNVTLGNSTTADTTLVNSVLNAQADITAVGYIRTNSKNAYIGTPGDQCHLKYDNSTKCLKFIFD